MRGLIKPNLQHSLISHPAALPLPNTCAIAARLAQHLFQRHKRRHIDKLTPRTRL